MKAMRILSQIGTAAKQAGISRRTFQYYVMLGLIEPTELTPDGKRSFDNKTIEKARLIRKLNDSGYPLHAIQELFFGAVTEAFYDREQAFLQPKETSQIAVVSNETWTKLIGKLSRSPELLHDLHPRKFEELIAELLYREGMDVRLTQETRDGGFDILAFNETPVGRHLYLVECKRHQPSRPVGVAVVRQLCGVVAQKKATAGLIVTTSRFSKKAIESANAVEHQMALKDYEALKHWLRSHESVS